MKYLYVLLLTLTVNACSGQRNQKTEESNVAPPTFEMVSVPTLITDPVERAEYLVKHYWDKFDFKDTTYIHEPQVTEQALSNYIDLMNYVSPAAMSSSVSDDETNRTRQCHVSVLFRDDGEISIRPELPPKE